MTLCNLFAPTAIQPPHRFGEETMMELRFATHVVYSK
jgi:hypothetical protein